MLLLCLLLWSALPPLALLSESGNCKLDVSGKSLTGKSLQCSPGMNQSLENALRRVCKQDSADVQGEYRTVHCRCNITPFSISTNHTAVFLQNKTLTICSSVQQQPLNLSQQLKARPPVGLSTHDVGDGDQFLSWSSPYPASSSLNENLTYQLSYKAETQDNWITVSVTNTSMKLEKQLLLPGHRYEARVRARARVSQWSNWSPVVSWMTKVEDGGQFPSLHCVLDVETEVVCSWKVSRELAQFITYQLTCQQSQTAEFKSCCTNTTVSFDSSGTVVTYSCSLTVTDPAQVQLMLQPTRKSKVFIAYQNICPNPPPTVEVKEQNQKWVVEWTEPETPSTLKLYYQVCHYKTGEKECSKVINISEGSLSLDFPGASLAPSQQYQVKVRSLVVPGYGSKYKGTPSEWSKPVKWTTQGATFSLPTFVYVVISVLVVIVFFTLYYTIPACRRRVVVWVDSVPSPGKSKILSEIKSSTNQTFLQGKNMSIYTEHNYDTISSCSLWLTTDMDKKHLEFNESIESSDNLLSPSDKVNSMSSLSFSGPYIFCQTSKPSENSEEVTCEKKLEEEKSLPDDSPSPVNFALFGEGYMCLPTRTICRSTQDLVSCSGANTNTQRDESTNHSRQSPDTTTPGSDKTDVQPGISETTGRDQPPPYTTGPFITWPIARYSFLSDEAEERRDTHQLSHDARERARTLVSLALTNIVEDMPPATRAAAVPTSSSCCPASSLFDGPGIYGSARVPLSSALRAGGQRLALRDCARVDGVSALWCLQLRYPKKKKKKREKALAL
ncbi:hypothetical protein INR49_028928, partial [Caranx melampygus]